MLRLDAAFFLWIERAVRADSSADTKPRKARQSCVKPQHSTDGSLRFGLIMCDATRSAGQFNRLRQIQSGVKPPQSKVPLLVAAYEFSFTLARRPTVQACLALPV